MSESRSLPVICISNIYPCGITLIIESISWCYWERGEEREVIVSRIWETRNHIRGKAREGSENGGVSFTSRFSSFHWYVLYFVDSKASSHHSSGMNEDSSFKNLFQDSWRFLILEKGFFFSWKPWGIRTTFVPKRFFGFRLRFSFILQSEVCQWLRFSI